MGICIKLHCNCDALVLVHLHTKYPCLGKWQKWKVQTFQMVWNTFLHKLIYYISDHHKSWQIIQIYMFAVTRELLLPLCLQQIKAKRPATLLGYYQWLSEVRSPNYKLHAELVFSYCLALHVFRAGVRRNNSAVIQTAKVKISPLFFGLNMPFYMETFVRDLYIRVQCPPQILAFIVDNESYSISGNESKGEEGWFHSGKL